MRSPVRARRPGPRPRRAGGRRWPRLPALRWPAGRPAWPGLAPARALRNWVRRHLQTLIGSLGRLAEQPLATAMTTAAIGIALALPAGLHLLVTNLQSLSGQWDDGIELSVYLDLGVPEARATALAAEVGGWPEVAAVQLLTAADALAAFRESSGLSDALDALESNPLPHLLAVRPAAGDDTPDGIGMLAQRLRALPEADLVQADADWARRLVAMLEMARRLALVAGGLLAIGVLVIIGNTVRLDIQNRRAEIEVMKLVGGTDAFIRRPLLYAGTWYGLGGGLVAAGVVQSGLLALTGPVERLATLYGSGFRPAGLGADGTAVLLLAGIALGWLGSWVSATWHLRRIEPGL